MIIDLSWLPKASVNAGIDKYTYPNSQFDLSFPTVDDIIAEFKTLGDGALLFKMDISRAFRHVEVDPGDYDLLGLQWNGAYIHTCLLFWARHGSLKGYKMILGWAYRVLHMSYLDIYINLLTELSFTVSQKKLICPSTEVVCLGVLINTEKRTISIPEKNDANS